MRIQGNQCLYALVDVEPKIDLVQTAEKVIKYILRITAKCHVHLQTLTKTPVKFKKDLDKIEGGVAFTIFDTVCDGQPIGRMCALGKNKYVSRS